MRLELRRRSLGDGDYRFDVVALAESESESRILDEAFGSTVDREGSISEGRFEVRLADGWVDHYVLLTQGEKR